MIFLLRYKKFTASYNKIYNINSQAYQFYINNVRISNRIQSTIYKWYSGRIDYNYGQSSADGKYKIIATLSISLFMGKRSNCISVCYYYKKILIEDYQTYGEDIYRNLHYGAARNLIYKTDSNISEPQNQSPLGRLRKWHVHTRSLVSLLDRYMAKLVIEEILL